MQRIKKLKNTLTNKNSFLRNVLTLTSGTFIAQAITVLVSPLITRLYSPEEMGLFASLFAVISIIGTVSAGRYELAVVLPDKEEDTNAVVYTGLMFSLLCGLLFSFIFGIFGRRIGPLIGLEDVPSIWLNIIGPVVFLLGIQNVTTRLCIRNRRFRSLASAQALQQGGSNAIKIGAGFLNLGFIGLFLGSFIGYVIRSFLLLFSVRKQVFKKDNFDINRIKSAFKRYKRFPLISSWSALVGSASIQIPVILFASLFSPAIAGYYALSHRILNLPMSLIGRSVGDVFIERSAKARLDKDELSSLTLSIYKKLLLIGAGSMSFVTFYGDIIFPFIFGSSWMEAGQYAQWISVWLIFVLAATPLGNLYAVLEKQGESLLFSILLFISRSGAIIAGHFFSLNGLTTIAVYACVGAVFWIAKCVRVLIISSVPVKMIITNTLLIIVPIYTGQLLISILIRRIIGI